MKLPLINDKLDTQRCILKIPQESEKEYMWTLITENITHYMIWDKGEDNSGTLKNIQETILKAQDGVSWDAAIYDRKTGKFIGRCGINKTDSSIPRFEIGYWLAEEYWGKGIIPECVHALTQYAFEIGEFEKGVIRCDFENSNSAKVATKCGYVLEGEFKNHERIKGKLRDTLYFGITKLQYYSQ